MLGPFAMWTDRATRNYCEAGPALAKSDPAAIYPLLRFTSFAYPDLTGALGNQETLFLQTYAKDFDPNKQYQAGTYGYNRSPVKHL
jgi:hypothetical protein